MVTWIEIADTAVKVGLGAAISGVATYFISRLNHDKEMNRDRLQRKRELLEGVADSAEIFSRRVRDYIALMSDWYDFDDPETAIPGHREVIETSQKALYDGFHELTSAECKLLLTGERRSRDKLRTYGESTQDLYKRVHVDRERVEKKEFEKIKSKLSEAYDSMFVELSNAYDSNV